MLPEAALPNLQAFERLLEAMPDGIFLSEPDGRIVYANSQAEVVSGYTRQELVGSLIESLVPRAKRGAHAGLRKRYLAEPASRPMGTGLDTRLRRKDGAVIPVDIALSPLRFRDGLLVVAAVRDITERRRAQGRLEVMLEISQSILQGHDLDTVLQLIARRARALVGADLATVYIPGDEPGELVLRVADGAGAARIRGMNVPVRGSLAGRMLRERRPLAFDDLRSEPGVFQPVVERANIGPAVSVRLAVGDEAFGTLTLANRPLGRHFGQADTTLLQVFAAQASTAVVYARIREELQRLAVAEDRERIARELHDGAIQALFAVGMGLQAAAVTSQDAAMRKRIESAVDQIDGVIRDLRNYIFGLRPGLLADRSLEVALRQAAEEFQEKNAVTTVVEIDPQVAARLSARAGDLIQMVGEALSNVGRHAQAQTCRVTLRRDGEQAVLEVEDDGVGFDPERPPRSGQGLRNFNERAARLGGTAALESKPGEGTTLRIRIPL